jgi:hypothetical protein
MNTEKRQPTGASRGGDHEPVLRNPPREWVLAKLGPFGISLDHLDRMTDPTGLIQHAIYSVPRRESGYTIDDNARALRLCTRLWCKSPSKRMLNRVTKYLSLLEYARRPGGGFHNLLSYQRHWLDTDGDGDCQGQAVRALAEVLGSSLPDAYRVLSLELIEAVLPTLAELRSLRAQAYVILAWGHLWSAGVKRAEPLESVAWSAAQRLVECYQRSQRPDWKWFESRMTYANAVLPHALFIAAQCWPKEKFLEVAKASFAFLDGETKTEDLFWPVGNNGWYSHGEEKARYDQQPVEAVTMAESALAAFSLLGEEEYLAAFRRARAWFHGRNSLGQTLVDVQSGACYDGLQTCGVNRNQGAESTLACLWTELHNSEIGNEPSATNGLAITST